ncbi:uncharacterized protein [Miscanthus floridulus]|uniref:uncharacterized protein isoform X2 n=1 Tax=Miscanthus floridulus TaxID=154761 RepID=UPI00345A81CE
MAAVAATWPGPMSATDGDLASGSEEDEGRGRGPKHESGRRWQLLERFLSSYEPTTPCSRRSNMPEQRNLILLRPFCNLLNLGVAKSTNQQQVYGNPAATGSNTFALPSEQRRRWVRPSLRSRVRGGKGREISGRHTAARRTLRLRRRHHVVLSPPSVHLLLLRLGHDVVTGRHRRGRLHRQHHHRRQAARFATASSPPPEAASSHHSLLYAAHLQRPLPAVTTTTSKLCISLLSPSISSSSCSASLDMLAPQHSSQPAVTVARPPLYGSWGTALTRPPTKRAHRSPWTCR